MRFCVCFFAALIFLLPTVPAQSMDERPRGRVLRPRSGSSGGDRGSRWEMRLFPDKDRQYRERSPRPLRKYYIPGWWFLPQDKWGTYLPPYRKTGVVFGLSGGGFFSEYRYSTVPWHKYVSGRRDLVIISPDRYDTRKILNPFDYMKVPADTASMKPEDAQKIIDDSKIFERAQRCSMIIPDLIKVIRKSKSQDLVKDAVQRLAEMTALGEAQLDLAQKSLSAGDYVRFVKLVESVIDDFEGLKISDIAREWLIDMRVANKELDNKITWARNEIKAEPLYKKAKRFDKKEKYKIAIYNYRRVISEHPKTELAKAAMERLRELRAMEQLKELFGDPKMIRQCKGWLNISRIFIERGDFGFARKYAEMIILSYPKSSYAEEARALLVQISEKEKQLPAKDSKLAK